MNILHHKSWHVRTKSNMERVRRDERKAAEDEQRVLDRQIQAENERRINQLRRKADQRMETVFGGGAGGGGVSGGKDVSISDETGHVNLFQDLEREERKNLGTGNADYEAEKAREKREWESKMGIQVYFADNTNDLARKKEWYEEMPLRRGPEMGTKAKNDRNLLPTTSSGTSDTQKEEDGKSEKKKKRKKRKREDSSDEEEETKRHRKSKKKSRKHKHHRDRDSSEERRLEQEYDRERKLRMEKMRDERVKRERAEKARQYALLHPEDVEKKKKEEEEKRGRSKKTYNSQFNPEFFRKN